MCPTSSAPTPLASTTRPGSSCRPGSARASSTGSSVGTRHHRIAATTESFNAFTDRVRDTPFTNQAARNFIRMLFSGATEEVPDKQGRISIPPVLREWAHLDRDCTVVGAMDRIEIWDSGRWTEFSEAQEGPFADMSEEVMPGIF